MNSDDRSRELAAHLAAAAEKAEEAAQAIKALGSAAGAAALAAGRAPGWRRFNQLLRELAARPLGDAYRLPYVSVGYAPLLRAPDPTIGRKRRARRARGQARIAATLHPAAAR